jgi:Mn2+/Fe2+ NRAMP family transporter
MGSRPTEPDGGARYERHRLTAEDLVRAGDRARVLAARRGGRRLGLLWLLIGPGILVMLGSNDGPAMISYATSGATYGIGFFLPFIVILFLAAVVVQEMAMRVGATTHRGYGKLVFQRYGAAWGWLAVGDLLLTNLVTLITEFIAIRVGVGFFGVPAPVGVLLCVGLVTFSLAGGRYRRWERTALGLAVFNLLFVAAVPFVRPDPGSILHALATWSPAPAGSRPFFLLLLVSNIGATVTTPWMVYFQQSSVVDKGMTPLDLVQGRVDVALGGLVAAFAGCAALVAASPLFAHHVPLTALQGGAGFPQALRSVAGYPAAAIFALGLVEAGVLAVLTISASTGYAVGEAVASGHSFNRHPEHARLFYLLIVVVAAFAGAVILIPGEPLLAVALYANLFAAALLPATLAFLIMLANDGELMGRQANGRLTNVVAAAVVIGVSVAATAYVVTASIGVLHGGWGA